MDEGQQVAVEAYLKKTGRTFVPGAIIPIATDALVFAEYQQPWPTLARYQADRCIYDPETNEWLVDLVSKVLLQPTMPAIYVDVLDDGIALVDGCHRTTAYLIAGREFIWAQINQ
jgi:hypothetical protein